MIAAIFLMMGGKSRRKIYRLGRRIGLLFLLIVSTLFLLKQGYQYFASTGGLGEKARLKYEKQSSMGKERVFL